MYVFEQGGDGVERGAVVEAIRLFVDEKEQIAACEYCTGESISHTRASNLSNLVLGSSCHTRERRAERSRLIYFHLAAPFCVGLF